MNSVSGICCGEVHTTREASGAVVCDLWIGRYPFCARYCELRASQIRILDAKNQATLECLISVIGICCGDIITTSEASGAVVCDLLVSRCPVFVRYSELRASQIRILDVSNPAILIG